MRKHKAAAARSWTALEPRMLDQDGLNVKMMIISPALYDDAG